MLFDEHDLKKRNIALLLAGDSEGPIPGERRPWRRLALCYSRIAFAVVIRPDGGAWHKDEEEHAKAALYRYLKRIQLTLLESGLVYPLTAIAIAEQGTVARAAMTGWMSDQDWHRGDFTLYVEPCDEKAHERTIDLLSMKVQKLMDKPREPRTIRTHIQKLESDLPATGPVRELGNMILDVWRLHESRPFGDNEARETRTKLSDWIAQRIADARRLVESVAP
jgi:hypothetical protein